MALPISVTYTFATATSAIPLSQLDANFTTVVNGVNGIGNGTNSLSNVSITGGNAVVTTANATTLNVSGEAAVGGNLTVTGGLVPSSSFLRNRIINGAMVIDQRNAGASVSGDGAYPVDRWKSSTAGGGIFSMQQSSTAPAGFSYSVVCTVTTPDSSISSTDEYSFRQLIEGFNFADFGWGTADAKTVTLSFWVRSSITGTYAVGFRNSASNRTYPATYSISAANTWEYKTVTVPGDTTGTWVGATNGVGVGVIFSLGAGSSLQGTANAWNAANTWSTSTATQWIGTNGATFYITGVQLEVGSVATPFERRQYGQELALCQRYYQKSFPIGTAPAQNAGTTGAVYCQGQAASAPAYAYLTLKVTMRATPSTVTLYNPSAANGNWRNLVTGSDINSNVGMSSDSSLYINANTQVLARYEDAAIHYSASAEL